MSTKSLQRAEGTVTSWDKESEGKGYGCLGIFKFLVSGALEAVGEGQLMLELEWEEWMILVEVGGKKVSGSLTACAVVRGGQRPNHAGNGRSYSQFWSLF